MRRIGIVGAGQAGLVLGLGLRRHGYDVTIVTERSAEAVRGGRLISNQCLFHPALTRERELGINFWDAYAPEIDGVSVTVAGEPGADEPRIAWRAPFDHPAQSVDQRVKVSEWMTGFARLGGEIRQRRVSPEDLDDYAREFDLVLVAAGRGPQFDALFPRNAILSPYSEPQRSIGILYVKPAGDEPLPAITSGLSVNLSDGGEFFGLPVWSVDGPVYGAGFFGFPGGPLDCWDDVADTEQHFEIARNLLRTSFPWLAGLLENTRPSGPLDALRGRVQPVVRQPVGTLPSGAKVLAMGDTAVTNDPVAGQGANMAAHAARSYEEAILEHGDRPFDEEFMRRAFARYWDRARYSTRFTNDLLEPGPPPDHLLETLEAGQEFPEVAHRFAQLFVNPADYLGWLTDPTAARAYLADVEARTAS
ncbi:styrene monooxygenase/indole monooxygenase family protein [Amycolatopsis sp. NPDC059027]|uniref:styrene monooxygenase/indole monooxygenase family protein n=1 Tax=Amycolatopsis sp. NPDC059027 TaxID=3346709 RepID=UPI00366E61AB